MLGYTIQILCRWLPRLYGRWLHFTISFAVKAFMFPRSVLYSNITSYIQYSKKIRCGCEKHKKEKPRISKMRNSKKLKEPKKKQEEKRGKRVITNLFKAYTSDEDRYSGYTPRTFVQKFMLFNDRCSQANISEVARRKAFLTMLTRNTLPSYLEVLSKQTLDLMVLSLHTKERFQTPERTRALLREWNLLALMVIIKRNTEKIAST